MRARIGGLVLGLLTGTFAGLAYGNPQGPQVNHGVASFSRPDLNTLNITNSPNAIINWRGFSINVNEITRFIQQSSNSAVLNRVVGQDPSQILGQLLSNGRVFLINPNGVVFGRDSVVDVAGLIASTLDIKDEDFLAGQYEFEAGANAGSIENHGLIRAGPNGEVVLIAPSIENSGIIEADDGQLLLAAGRKVTFTSFDAGGIQFEIQAPEDQVLNVGRLIARRGTVGAFAGTLRNTGRIEADTMTTDAEGNIVLSAKADIQLEQHSVVAATGHHGGSITIESDSGTVWIDGNVNAAGTVTDGGQIKLLGERVAVLDNAEVAASGETGGGKVLVGGDIQGQGETKTAVQTFVAPDATVRADAVSDGDGGEVIVFAEQTAGIHGHLSARGGSNSGDGGFVETSARESFNITSTPDTTAPKGDGGTWLIDPNHINIVAGSGNTNINAGNPFLSTADGALLGVDLLTAALSGGQNVTVTTGTGGLNSEAGNIALTVPFDINNTTGTNTLTFSAAEHIFIQASITDSQPGGETLNLVLLNDTNGDSSGGTFVQDIINLGPGSLTTTGDFVQLRDNAQIIVDGPTATWTDTNGLIDIGFQTNGTVVIQNGGSLVVTGNGGVRIGSDGGTGTLNILSGGVVDIASDFFNNLDIGFDFVAGSTGFVTVDGAGSRLITRGVDNTVQIGRRGAGNLSVSAGGRIDTLQFEVAREGIGNATITGAGSLVVASNDTGNYSGVWANEAGFVRAGRENGSIGTLQVLDGARLEIRESNTESAPELQLGRNLGSQGQVLVDGIGSVIDISQSSPVDSELGGPFLIVGARGQGDLVIQNGGEVRVTGDQSTVFVSLAGNFDSFFELLMGDDDPNPGPVTAQSSLSIVNTGQLFINGSGAAARLVIGNGVDADGTAFVSGTGSAITLDGFNPKLDVGRLSGSTGDLQIAAGGRVDVNGTTPFLGDSHRVVIARDPGSIGSITVNGDGSELNAGRRLVLGLGESATHSQFTSTPGGDGELTILGGGRVSAGMILLGGNASTPGQVTVSGAGSNPSTLEVVEINGDPDSRDRLVVGVEAGSVARLDVTAGARVDSGSIIQIARWEGSVGDVVVDNAVLTATGVDTNFLDEAAQISVGRGGIGTLTITNNGTLLIDSETLTPGSSGGLFVGGSSFVSSGERTGTVTVDGAGSRISLLNGGMQMRVGRDTGSSGTLNIINGGEVIFDNPNADVIATVAPLPGTGAINVDGVGSVLDFDGSNPGTARLFVGLDSSSNAGGAATVSVLASGNLLAGNIDSAGRLQGDGTFTGSVSSRGGTVAPGTSAGTMTVTGDLVLDAASEYEAELAGTGAGQFDILAVGGNATLGGTLRVTEIDGFETGIGDNFQVMTYGSSSGAFDTIIRSFGDILDVVDSGIDLTVTVLSNNDFITWLGTAGNFLWTDPLNWDAGVPTTADDVLVNPAGGTILVNGSGSEGAGRLQMTENLIIDGDPATLTFDVTDESFIDGFLIVENGTFQVLGTVLDVAGNVSMGFSPGTDGTIVVDGGTLNHGSGTNIGFDGSGTEIVRNGGTVNMAFGASVGVNVGSVGALNISNGGTVNVEPGISIGDNDGSIGTLNVESGAMLNVDGSLTVRRGTATIDNASAVADFMAVSDTFGSSGTLNILSGGSLVSSGGFLGRDPGSTGTATVDGAGSRWTVRQFDLDLGRQGDGTLTVQNGGALDTARITIGGEDTGSGSLTVDAGTWTNTGYLSVGQMGVGTLILDNGSSATVSSGLGVGDFEGANGTVTVRGGSTFDVSPFAIVARGSVCTVATCGFDAIRTGAPTNGTLNIETASSVTTTGLFVGFDIDAIGILNVTGGSSLESTSNFFDNVIAGYLAGSSGTVTVSGANSQIVTKGTDNVVMIGWDGSGDLTVDSGGLVDTLQFEVGRAAPGTATISGVGSKVLASNQNGRFSGDFDFEAGFARVGRDFGSDAVLNVLDHAVVEIRPGISQNTDTVGAQLQIARNGGSIGAVTVDGAGSLIDIFDLSQADTGSGESAGGLQVGRGGDGSLDILNGGEVRVTAPAEPFINVGRDAGAIGDLLVSGDGSRLSISGFGNGVNIGRGGQGTLTIDQGASMTGVAFINIGRNAGSSGSVTVDGTLDPGPGRATLALAGVWYDGFGSALRVGRGGTGTLDVRGGALLSLDSTTGIGAQLELGGSSNITGGTGTATFSGAGTELRLIGNSTEIDVGREGVGILNLDGGAVITGGQSLTIGVAPGSNGTVNADGAGTTIALAGRTNSQAEATCLAIGCLLREGQPAELEVGNLGTGAINLTGSATLTIDPDNSGLTPTAGFEITSLGTIGGTGTITGDVDSSGGLIVPGSITGSSFTATGPSTPVPGGTIGTLDIDGNLVLDAASRVDVELFGTGAGQFDVVAVTGTATLGGTLAFEEIDGFTTTVNDNFQVMTYAASAGALDTVISSFGDVIDVIDTGTGLSSTVTSTSNFLSWDGGGGDFLWTNAINWSGDNVPTIADDVVIGPAGNAIIVDGAGSEGANRLQVDERFFIDGTPTLVFDIAGDSTTNNDLLVQNGTLRILNGATLTSNGRTSVGDNIGTNGAAIVDGGTWNVTNSFSVGSQGTGTLTVQNGGMLNTTGFTTIGDRVGGDGSATVTGPGSLWTGALDLFVGFRSIGSLVVEQGATVAVGALTIGHGFPGGPFGQGDVVVRDAGTAVVLNRVNANRLGVGNGGTGSLTVEGGGVVNAAANPGACESTWCGNFVGNSAGSTGTVTITGAGSRIDGLDDFHLASANVQTVAVEGFDFGTPGADAIATINILNGGVLTSEWSTISSGASGSGATGTETSHATILIDGPGSRWENEQDFNVGFGGTATLDVTSGGLLSGRNAWIGGNWNGPGGMATVNVAGAGSLLSMTGTNPNEYGGNVIVGFQTGTGILDVSGGAQLMVDVQAGNGGDFIVGNDVGSTGTFTIDGAGSSLIVKGIDSGVFVGSRGTGNMTASGGARIETFNFQAGSSGIGTITVTDPGTRVVVSNDHGHYSDEFFNEAGFVRAGRNAGGDGTINVLNGAVIEIRETANESGPGIQMARNLNSRGTLLVDGAGSLIDITQSAPVDPFLGGPFLNIGHRGEAHVTIRNGGEIRLTGNESSVAVSTGIAADGFSGSDDPNPGPVTVQSTLDIAGGGRVVIDGAGGEAFFTVGRDAEGDGVVTIDGAGSELSLRGRDPEFGAFASVGFRGAGDLTVSGGGLLTVDGDTAPFPGLGIGGIHPSFSTGPGDGSGTVTVTGTGSAIQIVGDTGIISLGRTGTGTLNVDSGASVTGATFLSLAQFGSGSVGNLNIDGGTVALSGVASAAAAAVSSGTEVGEGAGMGVGVEGTATVSVTNAGQLTIIPGTPIVDPENGPGISVGGTESRGGGTGSLLVDGAGSLVHAQGDFARLSVGRDGTGSVDISGGALLQIDDPGGQASAFIGVLPGSDGIVTIDGAGSQLDVGQNVLIGLELDQVTPGGTGTLALVNGATVTASTVTNNAGTISGAGTITGDVISQGGSLLVGGSPDGVGILVIGGDLNLDPNSIVEIELAGTNPVIPEFDIINVTGSASLDGTLDIALSGGFVPVGGEEFQVITCGSCGGVFSTVNRPLGVGISTTPGPTDFSLSITAAGLIEWILSGSGLWTEPTNWSGGVVPTAADGVLIDVPAGLFTVTVDSGAQGAGDLVSDETLEITGGSLDIVFDSTTRNLVLSGGTLQGTGNLTVSDTLDWSGGTLTGTVTSMTALDINGVGTKVMSGGVLNNAGAGVWSGGQLQMDEGSVLNNLVGGTFDLQSDDRAVWLFGVAAPAINNAGTLTKSAGTGGSSELELVAFNNTGTVQVLGGGTLTLGGGGTGSGAFDIDAGGVLEFPGVYTLDAGSSVAGDGTVAIIPGADVDVAGSGYALTGETQVSGGTVNFDGPSSTASLVMSTGEVGGGDVLTVNGGVFDWSGGTLTGTVTSMTALDINGAGTKVMSGGVLNNAGAGVWSGGQLQMDEGSVLNNLVGGTFDLQSDDRAVWLFGVAAPAINNAGTLTKSAGTGGSSELELVAFNNTGTVQVLTGALGFTSYDQTAGVTSLEGGNIASSGSFSINAGTLQGSGSITAANVDIFGATVAPGVSPGRLDIVGDLSLDSSSVVKIELAGTNPAIPEFDIIDVSGTANLAGTLDIVLFGGYSPTGGENFQVISCGLVCNGSFDTVNQPVGVVLNTTVNPLDVTLSLTAVGVVRWIAAGGGLWTDEFNWEGGALPTAADSVLIDVAAGLFTITLDSGAQGVGSLVSDETLAISGGSLDIISDSMTRNLDLSGGTLLGTGVLTVNETFDWTGGTIEASVDVLTALNISGAAPKGLTGAVLTNFGAALWSGGSISASDGAVVNNPLGASFDIQDDQQLIDSGGVASVFNNAGNLTKSAGTGSSSLVQFNNSGAVQVSSGTLALTNGGTGDGTFTAAAGSTLDFAGGTHTLSATSSVSGAGTVAFGAGSADVLGSYAVTGTTAVSGGTVNFDVPASSSNLALSAGTLDGSDVLSVADTFTWTGGSLSGTVDVATAIDISGPGTKFMAGGVLNNAGAAVWSDGPIESSIGSVVNNLAGATFDLQSDHAFVHSGAGAAPVFTNAGTVTKSAGAGLSVLPQFNNSGTLQASAGTIDFAGYDQSAGLTSLQGGSLSSSGSFTINAGRLQGSGSITAASVDVFAATLAPGLSPGRLDIVGNLNLDPNSIVEIELAGTNPAVPEFDIIDVTGTANLDGTLDIVLFGGYSPTGGEAFQVISCGIACNGTFDTVNQPFGVVLNTAHNPFDVTLSVQSAGVIRWITAGGGLWTDPFNWEGGVLPTSADSVLIDVAGGPFTISLDSGAQGVSQLVSNETLAITGGSLDIATDSSTRNLVMSGGTLLGTGALTVSDTFDWSGGTLAGTVDVATMLNINGAATKLMSGAVLNNAGTGLWTGLGDISAGNGAVFNNLASGSFDIQNDQAFSHSGIGATPTLNNAGVLNKSAGVATSVLPEINNSGIVQSQSGTLMLSNGGVSSGAFSADAGSTLSLLGNHVLDGASSVAGAGTVAFLAGTTDIDGSYAVTGTTNIQSGATTNFNTDASTMDLIVAGTLGGTGNLGATNSVAFAGGTIDGDLTIEPTATANLSASALNGAGSVDNLGTLIVSNGTVNTPLSNSGTLIVTGGPASTFANLLANDGTLRVEGDAAGQAVATINGDFSNTGVIVLDSSTATGARIALTGGSLTNTAGAVIRSQGAAGGTYTIDAPLVNQGTIDIDVDTAIVNAGRTFSHEAGTVDIAGGATLAVNGGTFDWIGGTLAGTAASTLDLSTTTFLLSGAGDKSIDGLTLSVNSLSVGAGSLSLLNGTLNTTGPTTVAAGATLNATGGTLLTDNDITIDGLVNWGDSGLAGTGDLVVGAGGQLALGGTLDKTLDARNLNNSGTVLFAGTGNLNMANNAMINNLAGGTTEIQSDGTISGDASTGIVNTGVFSKTGGPGTTNVAMGFDNNGAISVSSGILSLQGNGTHAGNFNIGSGAIVQFAAGTHNFAGATTFNGAGTVDLAGGVWDGSGDITNNARINLTGGSISRTGNIANGGTIDAQVNGVIDAGGLSNTGLLMKSGGAGTTTITAPVISNGGIQVSSGILDFANGLIQTGGSTELSAGSVLAAAGTIDLSGGNLGGTGTINASVANSGGVIGAGATPGQLAINGDYIQGPGGSMTVRVGGTSSGPPTQFDIVDISGAATLGGTLDIILINGFQPSAGDSFDILNYGNITQIESPPGSGQFVASNFAVVNAPPGIPTGTSPQASSFSMSLDPAPPPPAPVLDPIEVIETVSEVSAVSTTSVIATINNDPIVNFSAPPSAPQGDQNADAPTSTGTGETVAGITQGDSTASVTQSSDSSSDQGSQGSQAGGDDQAAQGDGGTDGDPAAQGDDDTDDDESPEARSVAFTNQVNLEELGESPVLICQ